MFALKPGDLVFSEQGRWGDLVIGVTEHAVTVMVMFNLHITEIPRVEMFSRVLMHVPIVWRDGRQVWPTYG